MRTLTVALAAALCLAAAIGSASAQAPSYEGRGYGGPLYVGPNFQQGGQHAPPVYGQGTSKSERAATRRERSVKSHKAPSTREAKTEKPSAPKSESAETAKSATVKKADSENSTISSTALHSDVASGAKADASTPVTCKRYIAAVGQTVSVPCD